MKNLLNRKLRNKKGFTLAELLIVVAIIGVLVAISIPIFTAQLEKAREATDAANIRAAYAEMSAAVLSEDATLTGTKGDITYALQSGTAADGNLVYTATIKLHQTKADWQSSSLESGSIGGISAGSPTAGGTATLTISEDGSAGTLTYKKD